MPADLPEIQDGDHLKAVVILDDLVQEAFEYEDPKAETYRETLDWVKRQLDITYP